MQLLCEKFERMGVRVKVASDPRVDRIKIDIGHDRKGEFFDLKVSDPRHLAVNAIDLRPRDRHLLLSVRDEDGSGLPAGPSRKFLCGHDERAWFVAAVPEARGASNVREAMEALKPAAVRWAQEQARVRFEDRFRRKNRGFVRQGEWFFVPVPGAYVAPGEILRNEPLVRTGGKPHRVEFLARTGGELVYVDAQNRAITESQYKRLVGSRPHLAGRYHPQRRNMAVLCKGRVSHPDHQTILLRDWHAVYMNTENQSQAMRFVSFID
ncbi:MAG TPA: hypothetical protein VGI81_06355 [Tepidisphaeraceae bacterium]